MLFESTRYKKNKYNDSEEQMQKYVTLMSTYGKGVDIDFKFGGLIANTLAAHRLIQHYQEEMGPETANKIVDCKKTPFPDSTFETKEKNICHLHWDTTRLILIRILLLSALQAVLYPRSAPVIANDSAPSSYGGWC